MQIGIKLSSGRLLTRCILFADNDPKLSCKLQLQSNPTSAPYRLGRRGAPVASSRSRGILSRKERCPKCELRRGDPPDRSEVPADHVKFVKNDACTVRARHLSKPTAKGGCRLDRGKAAFRKWLSLGPAKCRKTSPSHPILRDSAEKDSQERVSATQEQTAWVSLDARKQHREHKNPEKLRQKGEIRSKGRQTRRETAVAGR